jgi:hypothetical protein
MPDDLMAGPLSNISLENGQALRLQWWEQILSEEQKDVFLDFLREGYQKFTEWTRSIDPEDEIVCWVGDSPTEYTGFMCFLANMLGDWSVSMIPASLAYKKRYKQFRPRSVGEIVPDELIGEGEYHAMFGEKFVNTQYWDALWEQAEDQGEMKKAIFLVVVVISLATFTNLRYGGVGEVKAAFQKDYPDYEVKKIYNYRGFGKNKEYVVEFELDGALYRGWIETDGTLSEKEKVEE